MSTGDQDQAYGRESTSVVGRDAELALLGQALVQAGRGTATAVLVSGEAGVGKTALVQRVLRDWRPPDGLRLELRCLPLHALSAGLSPLRTALQRSAAPAAITRSCLQRFDTEPLRAVDDWIDDVSPPSPVAVFVDDVQWADGDLRDVLLYLLAGSPDRRLSVLLTARTAGLPDGHPLHGWLADLLRLPLVTRLELGPLSRTATEAQLADLLGGTAHQSLVDEVFAASRGNPYLTSLLARGLKPTDQHLPVSFPRDLVTAVTGVWHGCTPATRALCCLLAVAGTPRSPAELAEVAPPRGLLDGRSESVAQAVTEAEQVGLLERTADDRLWFHHPLQAEVIEQTLPADERRELHAAFGRLDERRHHDIDLEHALHQASRYDRAGVPADAYAWAMRAWELRTAEPRSTELRRVLRRAIALRPQLPSAAENPRTLWTRVRTLAADAGAFVEELEAVDALLCTIDPAGDPLATSELLVRRMLLRIATATGFCSVPDMERAVELASVDPRSWQYALARSELAHAASWQGDPRAPELAGQALPLARAANHPTALSMALTAASIAALDTGDPETASTLAAEAADVALAAHDWWAAVHAVMWETNAMAARFGPEEIEQFARRRRQLVEQGAPTAYVVQVAAVEADRTLELGDAMACGRLLREALVCDPGPIADLRVRLTLARSAAYRGRATEALAHVSRCRELIAGPLQLPNINLDATWATALLAADRPAEAYQVAVTAVSAPGFPVDMVERLVPLAARAVAEQLDQLPEDQRLTSPLLSTLDELRGRFPQVRPDHGVTSELGRSQLVAMQSWYDAETARAYRAADEATRWLALQEHCASARLPWLEAYACWRAAESLLARGHGGRGDGVRWLRRGYDLAGRLGADPVRAELASLARLARVALPGPATPMTVEHPLLAHLTPREREITALLCTGRTYAEIAATLVISEKTVSSHVSTILRKTGTASRIELTRQLTRQPTP